MIVEARAAGPCGAEAGTAAEAEAGAMEVGARTTVFDASEAGSALAPFGAWPVNWIAAAMAPVVISAPPSIQGKRSFSMAHFTAAAATLA